MINKLVDKKLVPLSNEELAEYNQRLADAPSAFDMAMEDLRAKRNKLLADTDYIVTMNLEAGNTISAEWVTYRQSLRDLTNGLTTVEQVNAVVFPTKPE